MSQQKLKTTKEKLDVVLAFMGAGLNPEYEDVNQAIYEVVKEHYDEVLCRCADCQQKRNPQW